MALTIVRIFVYLACFVVTLSECLRPSPFGRLRRGKISRSALEIGCRVGLINFVGRELARALRQSACEQAACA
jgi:hypothetical protein